MPGSSVLSRTAIQKKKLLKEAVIKLKLVESTAELLSQRIRESCTAERHVKHVITDF